MSHADLRPDASSFLHLCYDLLANSWGVSIYTLSFPTMKAPLIPACVIQMGEVNVCGPVVQEREQCSVRTIREDLL